MNRVFVALAALLVLGCGGPFLVFPGGALRGEVVSEPITDWTPIATDAFVDLETRPSEPYSVELNYFVRDGELLIDPAKGRTWFDYLRADANARVRFGSNIYPVTAVQIAKPGELEGFDPDRYIYRLESRKP